MKQNPKNISLAKTLSSLPLRGGRLLSLSCLALGSTSLHAATLSINGASAPSSDLITSNSGNGSFTTTFSNHPTAGKTTRGQSFTTADTGDANTEWSVSALTIQKHSAQTYNTGDLLQLWIFAWNPSDDGTDTTNWELGDGLTDGDLVDGTGMTILLSEEFDIDTLAFTANGFITFDFSAAPLSMSENTTYGFLVGYQDGDTSASSSLSFTLKERAGGNPDYTGLQLRTHDETHLSFTRDTTFFLQGTSIPEPSSLLLVTLGGLSLCRRRR